MPGRFDSTDRPMVSLRARTHDLSRVNPFKPLSVTWGYQGKTSSDGK